ncbi:unnamed protein product, partial [Tetraodon nigroviridis]
MDLLSSFPEDQEISAYCRSLLGIFGRRYAAIVDCLVPAARPVKICQNCFSAYGSLRDIYTNISSDQPSFFSIAGLKSAAAVTCICVQGPGNESCRDPLLSSDRLMLVPQLYNSLQEIWSNCDSCIAEGYQGLTNDTLAFLAALNQTLTCFEKNQQVAKHPLMCSGNQTDPCKSCKSIYGDLNRLYRRLDNSKRVCIDMEDSMNATRSLWSKSFNCSVPREETVPVIAVSAFMLFLPIIFYLSSFLHSEQKKRKLIHPKRAKSYNSLVNIQDK